MTVKGEARHFHHKYKFRLEIDNIGSFAYQNMSELKVEIAKIEYYEGGVIIPAKEPGRMSFPDLTIERAATYDADLYSWVVDTANATVNAGLVTPEYKRNGFVVQMDRDNTTLKVWQLYGLWPMSFVAGAWDNNSDELTMEQVVLAYDYFVLRERYNRGSGADNLSDTIRTLGRQL